MDATSSNFAVSSLCAATATCSAGAVGLAWATTKQPARSASPATYLPDNRPTTSIRRSTSKRTFLARPKSAVVTAFRDNPWELTTGPPPGNRASYQSGTPVESLQEADEAVDIPSESLSAYPQRRASTWFRQRLTLTSSSGQSSQATDQPSTPSTYTNASNTPFIPASGPALTTRNRLVKRSTSQRFSRNAAVDSTPFRPTFRRPATSHQRSAETRVKGVRPERSHSSAAPSVRYTRDSSDSTRKSATGWHWEPFFKKHIVRVKGQTDTPLKTPGELFLGRKDELSCVGAPTGQLPTLVMAASITAQISIEPEFSTPGQFKGAHYQSYQHVSDSTTSPGGRKLSQFHENFPETHANGSESEPRVSSSFSLSNLLPSPSPAPFKIARRRSSRKHDPATPSSTVSRNVSDSRLSAQSRVRERTPSSNVDSETFDDSTLLQEHHLPHARSVSEFGTRYLASDQVSGSMATDQITNPKVRDSSSARHRHSFSGGTDKSSSGPALSTTPYSNPRLSRGSRVASDHGSTIHGSDTDNSRVFSINGDDYDTFSETNYDSFRTGGTNSSQSGRRITKIDGVFDELGREGFSGDSLSVLEEKLSDSSPNSSPKRAAEVGDAHTPSRHSSRDMHALQESVLHSSKDSDSSSYAQFSFPTFTIPSPTPGFPHKLTLASSQQDFDDDLDALWDVPEEEPDPPLSSLNLGHDTHASLESSRPSATYAVTTEPQKKVNLWDWSEKQQDDDRPKTVHGKNPADRGNRAGSRRPNVHVRSQSVPNVIDNNKARFNDAAKLDAWTLGGKGASEDWDEDFEVADFEDEPEEIGPSSARPSRELRSSGFVVPDTILEKQSSVHYQFSHVKELSQLVEILRRLRRTADDLGIRDGQSSALWVEAEGIIDLATLEEDEELAPPVVARAASPISADFDFDTEDRISTPQSTRQSVSAMRDDASTRSSPAQHLLVNGNSGTPPHSARPRQDSLVQAKSVLEHLHSHRNEVSHSSPKASTIHGHVQTVPPSTPRRQARPQKQPFDTQSLKDLVVRAGVVTRALQQIVRLAEEQRQAIVPGTPQSHKRSGSGLGIATVERDPLLSQLFQHPGPLSTPPSQRRSPLYKRERQGTPITPSGRERGASDFGLHGLTLDDHQ